MRLVILGLKLVICSLLVGCTNDARDSNGGAPASGARGGTPAQMDAGGDDHAGGSASGGSAGGSSTGNEDSGGEGKTLCAVFFASARSHGHQIWRAHPDLSNPEMLTDDPNTNAWWPRPSPTEDIVYFYRSPTTSELLNNDYDNASLWTMRRDGSGEQLVRPQGSDGWLSQGVIDFSHDGGKVVMAARTPGPADETHWHLFVANADLTGMKKVSTRDSLYLDPSFSPDGSRITYVSIPPDAVLTIEDLFDPIRLQSFYEVYSMNADGSDEQRLTFDDPPLRDHDPSWSPDGAEIVFETAVEPLYANGIGKWALRAVGAQRTAVRTVIDDGNINTLPRWNMAGDTLYFHRLIFGGRGWHLATIRPDGSALQALTPEGINGDVDVDLLYL